MTTIVTRVLKGSPLSWNEADANFTNLNTDKLEVSTAATTYTTKAANLSDLADAATARTNLGISATNTPNTPAGSIAATTVQAAINELDTEKAPASAATAAGTSNTPAGNIVATNVQAAINELDTEKADAVRGIPTGALQYFFMNSVPTGWLETNGSLISRTTYAALFSAIGTTYGVGDGSTTFQLPDMRGYFAQANGTNSDGTTSGTFGVKSADSLKNHTHDISTTQGTFAVTTGSGGGLASSSNASITGNVTSPNSGTETKPKSISLLCCIKT